MPKLQKTVPPGVPYYGPKAICKCGHNGDGKVSDHYDRLYGMGHGACKVEGCSCEQFTWTKWTPEFKKHKGLR